MPKLPVCSVCEQNELPDDVEFSRLKTLYERKNLESGKRKFVKSGFAVCGIFSHHIFVFLNGKWRQMRYPVDKDD